MTQLESKIDSIDQYPFLSGGGEMGTLTRLKDWSTSSVGTPDLWPQSLRTTLNIILTSKFPMFLWWGPELICFYNDAYRPSLGQNGKHPGILGMRANEAWAEIWDTIKPLIDQVLGGGGATWSDDQLIPIFRNGKIENVYWTFSYSPVNDESGKTNGVLVICTETTGKVNFLNEIKESKDQLEFAIDATELGTWDLNPVTNKFTGNGRLKGWFGLNDTDEIQLPVAMNVIAERDRERVNDAIQTALQFSSGGKYQIDYSIINPVTKQERIVRARGIASFNKDEKAYRFNGTLQDISAWIIAGREGEKSERRFRNIVKQAPLGISIMRGAQHIVEMANESYLQIIDKKENEFIGKPVFESLPEVEETVAPLLTDVLRTGAPFYGTEFPITINRNGHQELCYFNFVYHPLREEDNNISGIIVVASEVTSLVKAKHIVAESEKQFRNLVMQSPIPMAIFMGENQVIELANIQMIQKIWRKKESEVLGKRILDVFPELKTQKYPQLLREVYTSGKAHREDESVAYIEGNDGMKKFYLDFEYAPLFEREGTISGIIITVNDVTEKVEARHNAEDAGERLRLAVEATELATWDLDLQTQHLISSPRLAEIFGHNKAHEITFGSLRKQVHPDDIHDVVEKSFEKALRTGLYKYEARILKPGNKICWIRTQGKLVFDKEKKPVKLIGT
ncbi:MAG: PAS domain-containing protein, partial [Ginsengibacter sp.]